MKNPQNPVRKSPKHILQTKKNSTKPNPKQKITKKNNPKQKHSTKKIFVFGSRVGWGLEFGNTKLSNSKPEGTQVV